MQRTDPSTPGSPATIATTVSPGAGAAVRRRRGTRLRSHPQPRRQELAALEWQRLGACQQADQSVFFAPDAPGEPREDRRRRLGAAKRVCALCPVRETCRNYALENREEFGVWGGLSEAERRGLIEERRRRTDPGGGRVPAAISAGIPAAGQV